MRYWNQNVGMGTCRCVNHVFTLPMRYWNTAFPLHSMQIPFPSFYSTYEVLKRIFCDVLFYKLLCGFYSTYEVLKQGCYFFIVRIQNNGFYSTYEVLKLADIIIKCLECLEFLLYLWGIETDLFFFGVVESTFVFTLPMRYWNAGNLATFLTNPGPVFTLPMRYWNPGYQIAFFELSTVFTLPMRYWNTPCDMAIVAKLCLFLLYLWGIETTLDIFDILFYHTVFTLPMRYWNRVTISFTFKLYPEVFTLPMRYWNIAFLITSENLGLKFLLYLWGIETPQRWGRKDRHDIGFLLYLWGIETIFCFVIKKGVN